MGNTPTSPVPDWSLAESLSAVAPWLRPALVGGDAWARLQALAGTTAAWPCTTYAIEARLSPAAAQVDLALCTESGSELAALAQTAPGTSPGWRALAMLSTRFDEPSARHRIANVWVEFDLDQAPACLPAPALFVGPASLRRGGDQEPRFREGLAGVSALMRQLAVAAGVAVDVGALERHAEALPHGARVFQIGLMLSRRSAPLRLVVQRLPAELLPRYLEGVGREDYGRVARTVVEELGAPELAVDLQLEVGGTSGTAMGLELSPLRSGGEGLEAWAKLGERLVGLGLCSADKRDALLAWPSALEPVATQLGTAATVVTSRRWRRLSHVKVVCDTTGPVQAKGYLFFNAALAPARV
jgi:hypothetical protein